ncbi:visual pigment-like receptor peropsin [Zerene cesonia]|uniref:visual pigment-like receptor peropsin n=1 Tax=Zerene cesonia TaxID=33412 RepID=UPI0018E515D1|nr:visual pigment-like receptor peropsin [Zerene cesonia]
MDVKTAKIYCDNCVRIYSLTLLQNLNNYNSSNNMQTLFEYNEDECPWYYFDSSYKTLLGGCLIIFGVFGMLLNGWLFATFIHSHLLISKSHVLILNVCSASLGRNLLGFPFAASSAIGQRWLFGTHACQLFAFLNQFYGIFQMTTLFTVVLERYWLARYTRRERSIYYRYYWTLTAGSWLNAVVFAIPPLFGYGVYSCDATGTICTLLWPSVQAGAKHLGYVVPYVIVCGVVPVIGIFYYMGKASRLENIYYRNEMLREEKHLTKCIHVLSVITLALWIPAALVAGSQWFPLLLYGYRPHVPPVLALIAPITSEAATCVPVLCYLSGDTRLRAALLGRMRKNYALLPPQYAMRYRRD